MTDGTGSGTTDAACEVYRAEIERLSALVALQRKDMKQAMDDNQRLEDAMRQIQATTSDKAVQSITDEALCFITEQEEPTVCFICGEALDTMGRCNYHGLPVADTEQEDKT